MLQNYWKILKKKKEKNCSCDQKCPNTQSYIPFDFYSLDPDLAQVQNIHSMRTDGHIKRFKLHDFASSGNIDCTIGRHPNITSPRGGKGVTKSTNDNIDDQKSIGNLSTDTLDQCFPTFFVNKQLSMK